MIKNYACHRVYEGSHAYLSQSVVSITKNGEVVACKPLSQETAFTEWIGGVIFLSDKERLASSSGFKALAQEITEGGCATYAWHISNFDFQQEELTSDSIIRRL